MAEPALPEFKPHVFGKFFLLQRLAVGGMAEIYRARVTGTGGFEKELVVKRILPSRSQDQNFVTMLVNEAKLTVQLTHNNIAQIYECGVVDATAFIAMELVNGVSMKEVMQAFARSGQALSPEQSVFMVLQLLQGLDYAHKKTDPQGRPLQIVHCDVSPDNALVSFEGEVKLLDFGIARAATGLSNYKEGMLMGKLGYVAPEQASLERRWDHRVDVFAAGIVLYELLTKQKPFPKATDVESLITSRRAKVVPPTALDPRLPPELDQILAKALAYDPDRRFADARAFAEALVDVLFPTPHSAIQDLLGRQMQQVFHDRIQRQRQARAHDSLVMKVLANLAQRPDGPATGVTPGPISLPAGPVIEPVAPQPADLTPTDPRPTPARPVRQQVVVRRGPGWGVTTAVGLALAVAGALGLHFAEVWLRPGTVVVTSEPAGADVALDGAPTGQRTPAVLEGIPLSRGHELVLSGPTLRSATVPLPPEPGQLARRVHVPLASALVTLQILSDPPGAEVRVEDRRLGVTPLELPGLRADQRLRIDLKLPGYEIDQFVVLPEKDGVRHRRVLAPTTRPLGERVR